MVTFNCDGCVDHPTSATRVCFSCDPGGTPVNLCQKCYDRAHFGPMKLSHVVESLLNKRLKQELDKKAKDLVETNKKRVETCLGDLKGCFNDLENQKRTDIEVMSAAFEPLKLAVVKRKRELTAQIIAHYDSLKPQLESCEAKCKTYIRSLNTTVDEVSKLHVSQSDGLFEEQASLLESEMKDFDAQAIWDMLPRMKDGHTLDQVSVQEITRALNTIENCLLTSCPSVVDDDLINSLTLAPGDVKDVCCNAIDKDGIFWLKLNVPIEKTTPLYQLAYKCRQRLIIGESQRYSDIPDQLYTGMVVMVHHPEDSVWHRAVVTDPHVNNNQQKRGGPTAAVIVADSGYKLEVVHSRLAQCSEDDIKLPFLAVPCSLYPGEHAQIGLEPKWLFNDSIKDAKGKPRVFAAKFVHRKTAQHVAVPVWYVELSDKSPDSVSLNRLVEERRVACSGSKGSINHKDIRIVNGSVEYRRELCSMKDDGQLPTSGECLDDSGVASSASPGTAQHTSNSPPDATAASANSISASLNGQSADSHTELSTSNSVHASPNLTVEGAADPSAESVEINSELNGPEADICIESSVDEGSVEVCVSAITCEALEHSTEPVQSTSAQSELVHRHLIPLASHNAQVESEAAVGRCGSSGGTGDSYRCTSEALDDTLSAPVDVETSYPSNQVPDSKLKRKKSKKKVKPSRRDSPRSEGHHEHSALSSDDTRDACWDTSSQPSLRRLSSTKVSLPNRHIIRDWINRPGRTSVSLPSLQNRDVSPSPSGSTSTTVTSPSGSTIGCSSFSSNQQPTSPPVSEDSGRPEQDGSAVQTGTQERWDPSSSGAAQTCEDDWNETAFNHETTSTNRSYVAQPQFRDRHVCHHCGSADHFVRSCPVKPVRKMDQSGPCIICKAEGHCAENCEEARTVYFRMGCPYCLTTRHRMVNCPKRMQIDFYFLKKYAPGRKGNKRY